MNFINQLWGKVNNKLSRDQRQELKKIYNEVYFKEAKEIMKEKAIEDAIKEI